MNIEAYNLDSLRKLVRDLEKENKELRKLLDKEEIPYANKNTFSENIVDLEEYDLDQGARINQQYIDKQLATKFFQCFGEEKMYLPNEQRMEVIILNVIIVGITNYVRSKEMRKCIVRTVNINAG